MAEKIFVVGGFVATTQLQIIFRDAQIFTFKKFHWGALALNNDAIDQSPRALLAQLRESLAREQQPHTEIFGERFQPRGFVHGIAHQPVIKPPSRAFIAYQYVTAVQGYAITE